jgi:tryptophan-rich sensory protein
MGIYILITGYVAMILSAAYMWKKHNIASSPKRIALLIAYLVAFIILWTIIVMSPKDSGNLIPVGAVGVG